MRRDPAPCHTLAALGGPYGNLPALDACLADARAAGAEVLACLGDAVGCYGHSEAVLAKVEAAFDVLVAGNSEQEAAAGSTVCGCGYDDPEDERVSCQGFGHALEGLSAARRAWIGAWPERAVVETAAGPVLLCHGSPGRTNEFLYASELDAGRLEAWLDQFGVVGFVCTHSGLPWVRHLSGGRFAANCGVVGKPDHDGDPAVHYALLRLAAGAAPSVEIRRVEYDHLAWAARLEAEGFEAVFVAPIRTGWWTTGVKSLPEAERRAAEARHAAAAADATAGDGAGADGADAA